jgi:hypothetical protein
MKQTRRHEEFSFYFFLVSILLISPAVIGMTAGFLMSIAVIVGQKLYGLSAAVTMIGLSLSGIMVGTICNRLKRK